MPAAQQIRGEANFDSIVSKTRKGLTVVRDPVLWQEKNLGVELFSNQMDITEAIFDRHATNINILGCRGSGKSVGVGNALAALCSTVPNQHVISTAPILPQAGRIIKFVKLAMEAKGSKVRDLIDWGSSSAMRLVWKNGNTIVGVSGQERASTEGEHGNIIVMDEAHLIPGHSVSSKLQPMLSGIGVSKKVIKLGVAMGRGHFYRTFNAKEKRNCVCKWMDAEVHLMEPEPNIFYHGRQVSRALTEAMPLHFKLIYFPDRPDLQELSGHEISVMDWQTQYELDWVADINNFLSEEDHGKLGSGDYLPLTRGRQGERYFAGLDTSQGSWSGFRETDWTVLAIWRLNRSGSIDKVASFRWRNQYIESKEEIWDICHPKHGLFKCEAVLVDYSNVGVAIVEEFRKAGMPITGVPFSQSSKTITGMPKSWKTSIYDYLLIGLQGGRFRYPGLELMRTRAAEVGFTPEEKTQFDNFSMDYFEWGVLQRIRGRGLNDKIQAPTDKVEDDEEGGTSSKMAHDDACDADCLAVWAAGHPQDVQKMMASGGHYQGYVIPKGVSGATTAAAFAPGSAAATASAVGGENPYASWQRRQGQVDSGIPGEDAVPPSEGNPGGPATIGDWTRANSRFRNE